MISFVQVAALRLESAETPGFGCISSPVSHFERISKVVIDEFLNL